MKMQAASLAPASNYSGCPLVKARLPESGALPRINSSAITLALAFGIGLMVAAISSGPF